MAKMFFFVADPMTKNNKLVVQGECGSDSKTGSAKKKVSLSGKKKKLKQYDLLHKSYDISEMQYASFSNMKFGKGMTHSAKQYCQDLLLMENMLVALQSDIGEGT